jgi:hypothetical protein
MIRMSSGCSLFGALRWCDSIWNISVIDSLQIASSMSVRESMGRISQNLSVLQYVTSSSQISLRNFSRLGSSVSVSPSGNLRCLLTQCASTISAAQMGSSASLRSYSRVSSHISIVSATFFGSALSLRKHSRNGSALSAHTGLKLGNIFSMCNCANFGSGLSLRSFGNASVSASLLSFINIGSALSLRN